MDDLNTVAPITPPTPTTHTTTPVPTTSIKPTTITRTLVLGMSGGDVLTLQNTLIKLNFLSQGSNTGYFGPATKKAVQAFQWTYGIATSGTETTTGYGAVGKGTVEKMGEVVR